MLVHTLPFIDGMVYQLKLVALASSADISGFFGYPILIACVILVIIAATSGVINQWLRLLILLIVVITWLILGIYIVSLMYI